MSKSQIQGAAGAMRKIDPLHRSTLVDYGQPEDRAEWGRMNQASANADAPDLYAPAPRIPRERKASSLIGPVMGVAVVVLVALGSCVAQVAK